MKNVAEHKSGIELGVVLASLATVRKQKTMIRLTVSGRARQSCVDETHEMVDFLLFASRKGNSERNIAVLSQELCSHLRLAIVATMADGPYELIQERPISWQRLGWRSCEGGEGQDSDPPE